MIHKTLKKSVWALLLITSLAACGNENAGKENGAQQGGTIQTPNAGNLPVPSGQGQVDPSENPAEGPNTIFFQRKDMWDSFSTELKAFIQNNYSQSGTMTGAGAGGHGYYNTLFGRTSPGFGSSGSAGATPPVVSAQAVPSGSAAPTLQLKSAPMALTSAPACNAASTFLCLDRPADKEGTVVDSILVQGAINLDEAALFTPTDPVVLISVFRQSGEAVNEYALKAGDLTSIPKANPDDPQTASFGKTVGLAGPGGYTIIVSAFKNVEDSVILESIAVSVTRQDVPEIELAKLEPPPEGNLYPTDSAQRHKPVNSGDTVSMASVKVTVRLKSPGTSHVGILFQNFDESGTLRYISNGDTGFGSEEQDDGTTLPTKSADLVLFQGLNHITIVAHNDLLDELGLSPDNPSTIDVNLTNVVPMVKVKMISPKDASIVEATGGSDQKVDVNFCLTDLTSLPGRPSPAAAGECISNWDGEKPTVTFNGYSLPASSISKDGSGTYSTQVKPLLGGNLVQVSVTNTHFLPPPDSKTPALSLGTAQASFGFGKVEKLFVNGNLNETNNFPSRGLSLEINKKLITGDVKTMVLKFLNDPDFKQTFIDLFKKTSPGITNVCTEVDGYSVDTGDSSIDLLPDTVHLGDFEIIQLEPQNDNKLHIIARLNGFSGEADIRGLNSTVQIQEDGVDLSFIPITIGIKQMTIAVDLTFNKKNGSNQMDLLKDSGHEIVEVVGTDALGRFVWINSSRNPLAAGLEQVYGPGDVLGDTFLKSLKRNFVCGLENNLNNATTGLGKWEEDIQKLVSYNNLNPFRIPLEFDLLNKLIGIDIAYDVLRGDITFNDRGLQVQNVPLRIGPSPRVLNHLVDLLGGSISQDSLTDSDKQILASPNKNLIGSLSAPTSPNEQPSANSSSTEVRNVGVELPEDALNQALAAASLAGLLDLDIDPNFWSNNNITFIDKATPTVQDMIGAKVDINQNGVEDDDRLPVQLKLTTDKTLPPVLHFLSQSEINALADRTNCFLNQPSGGSGSSSSQSCDPSSFTQKLNTDLKYFRLTLSNVDMAIYRVYPVGKEVGGVKTYCSKDDPVGEPDDLYATRPKLPPFKLTGDSASDSANRACRQTVTPLNETTDDTCPEGFNKLVIPLKNGPVISAVPVAPGSPEAPVVRYKGDLVIHGVMQGIFREVLFSDQNKDPNAAPVNFLRVKFMPTDFGPESLYLKLKVVENHTGLSEAALTNQLSNVLIPGALGTNCETLNELQIPIPDRFPSATAQSVGGFIETLHSFGVDHLDFGNSKDELPQVFVDDNHMYVDLLAHIGVCYQGDACVNPPMKFQPAISSALMKNIPIQKFIDWTKH